MMQWRGESSSKRQCWEDQSMCAAAATGPCSGNQWLVSLKSWGRRSSRQCNVDIAIITILSELSWYSTYVTEGTSCWSWSWSWGKMAMTDLPVLYHVVPALRTAPKNFHKYLVLLLTFLAYTSYHLSRYVLFFLCILSPRFFITGSLYQLWRTLMRFWTVRTEPLQPITTLAHPG